MLTFTIITGIINCLTALALSILVFYKKRELKQALAVNLSIAFWSFFYCAWLLTIQPHLAALLMKAVLIGMVLIPHFFLRFCYEISESPPSKTIKTINTLVAIAIISTANIGPYFIKNLSPILDFPFWPKAGPLFPVYLAYFTVIVILGHWILFKKVKENPKIWYIIIGFTLGFGGAATNFFFWLNIPIPPVGNIGAAVYVSFATYAIIKHNLLDIRIVVSKSLALVITATLFTAGYLGLIYWPYFTFESKQISPTFLVLTLVYGLGIGLYFQKLQNHLQTFSDWVLFQHKVEKETLDKLVVTLHHEINSPLTAISLSAQHLETFSGLPEPAPHLITIIRTETKKISTLLSKFRKLSKIQSKEYIDGIEMIDLED